MNDKIEIPPMEEVVKHNTAMNEDDNVSKNDEENVDDEGIEEDDGRVEGGFESVPNIPPVPPLSMGGDGVEEDDEDEEQKSRRGRPKTIHAKTACAKSMLVVLNKLKKIHSKSLQCEVKELAEDAMIELNHLHEIINKIL
jgi:hypothetical protein